VRKVLIANRGEIAVRIIRACRDAGLASVAVYAEPDRDTLHVSMADEACPLDGQTAAGSYLDIEKILKAAAKTGADAVHPGYGFLAENAAFARAVQAVGRTWIGPPPAAIDALGDKVRARQIARRVGAPLAPGTDEPVGSAADAESFARHHGLPIAIKAVYGGGGRGLKVARTIAEVGELYESAVREATATFGRGECFVERYLDQPRHVETQCLADQHGNAVVVSTRDCSLQRRHQKVVEEAPAPFLSEEHDRVLRDASKALLRETGYTGAGTCEFLIGNDGTLSFLEVNTRLQVEHPVTEEISGIDLVMEMFRVADGQPLTYGDPPLRGHSIEFRINAEDPTRGFVPAPGTITSWRPPSGPGVRLDAGYGPGMTVPQAFDSLIAKLIVTGASRREAIARARRALAEFEIGGTPTLLPFHRAVVTEPAFTGEPFLVHTRWIETDFNAAGLPADAGTEGTSIPSHVPSQDAPSAQECLVVESGGKQLRVTLPAVVTMRTVAGPPSPRATRARRNGSGAHRHQAPTGDALTSPMQGTIVKIAARERDRVATGDTVVVLEAMKMEQPVTAHKGGTITGLAVAVGQTVSAGAVICHLEDR